MPSTPQYLVVVGRERVEPGGVGGADVEGVVHLSVVRVPPRADVAGHGRVVEGQREVALHLGEAHPAGLGAVQRQLAHGHLPRAGEGDAPGGDLQAVRGGPGDLPVAEEPPRRQRELAGQAHAPRGGVDGDACGVGEGECSGGRQCPDNILTVLTVS